MPLIASLCHLSPHCRGLVTRVGFRWVLSCFLLVGMNPGILKETTRDGVGSIPEHQQVSRGRPGRDCGARERYVLGEDRHQLQLLQCRGRGTRRGQCVLFDGFPRVFGACVKLEKLIGAVSLFQLFPVGFNFPEHNFPVQSLQIAGEHASARAQTATAVGMLS